MTNKYYVHTGDEIYILGTGYYRVMDHVNGSFVVDVYDENDNVVRHDHLISADDLAATYNEYYRCAPVKMVWSDDRIWYAVQRDRDDDWGTGSYDLTEAQTMLSRMDPDEYPEALIACIQHDVCIDEIRR